MSIFSKNNTQTTQIDARTLLQNKYNAARHNLLIVLAFTLVNILLMALDANSYFLFSAYIPYWIVGLGMLMCGMFPAEYYELYYGDIEFLDQSVFAVLLAIALVLTSLYLLCWIFSKKNRVGWLIFALVWFGIDSAFLLLMMGDGFADFIMDIVFHAWVIVSLVNGIRSYYKLKNMPEDEPDMLSQAVEEVVSENQDTAEAFEQE